MLATPDYHKGLNDGIKSGFNQGYEQGFAAGEQTGIAKGMIAAKRAVAEDFVDRLQVLRNEKGIGPKTWEKIIATLDLNKEEQNGDAGRI